MPPIPGIRAVSQSDFRIGTKRAENLLCGQFTGVHRGFAAPAKSKALSVCPNARGSGPRLGQSRFAAGTVHEWL